MCDSRSVADSVDDMRSTCRAIVLIPAANTCPDGRGVKWWSVFRQKYRDLTAAHLRTTAAVHNDGTVLGGLRAAVALALKQVLRDPLAQ
jgi:hypothetical protein